MSLLQNHDALSSSTPGPARDRALRFPGQLRALPSIALPLALLLTAAPAAAQEGYHVLEGTPDQLYLAPLDGSPPSPVGDLAVEDIFGLAFDSSGELYGVSAATDELLTIDPGTAQVTSVGPLGFDASVAGGLTFDPAGDLWLVNDNNVYSVDPATGQATFLGALSVAEEVVRGLSACGEQLTALYYEPGNIQGLASIDPTTLVFQTLGAPSPAPSSSPAGVDHHGNRTFSLENHYSLILPIPMTTGTFLVRWIPEGGLGEETWLDHADSLSFAIGPPRADCPAPSTAVVEVSTLSSPALLALFALLAIIATLFLARRTI